MPTGRIVVAVTLITFVLSTPGSAQVQAPGQESPTQGVVKKRKGPPLEPDSEDHAAKAC
jgi:hypothetical protein